MSNIKNSYINALLADAAYINFTPGEVAADMINAKGFENRFGITLATYIAENFEVISAINTSDILGSGFDAVVWRGREGTEFAGRIYVSMRGTEGAQDFLTDFDLAYNAGARDQIISMVNWWLRETTAAGEKAPQLIRVEIPGPIDYDVISLSPISSTGTGRLVSAKNIEINGHSLGGHLATSLARLFGGGSDAGLGSVDVESLMTFNTGGFNKSAADDFFSKIDAVLNDVGMSSLDVVDDKQINFYAENGINVTTNDSIHSQIGKRVGLYQEEGLLASNHYMYRITDLLALGSVMEKLDPNLSLAALNQIIAQGSHIAAGSLEGVLDALRRAVLGTSMPVLAIGDSSENNPIRVAYHDALFELQDSLDFQVLKGKLTFSAVSNTNSMVKEAKEDFAQFLALHTLSPILIYTQNEGALAALQATHADAYTAWQADLVAREAGDKSHAYTYTDQWYQDRSAMLGKLVERNLADDQKTTMDGQNIAYTDIKRAEVLRYGSWTGDENRQQIKFGSEKDDVLIGGGRNDRLYGGAGNDILFSGGGADYLEGGADYDIYRLDPSNPGGVTIYDSDGLGVIEVKGKSVTGSFNHYANASDNPTDYYSSDSSYKLSRVGAEDSGHWRLLARGDSGSYELLANLTGWKSGDLGLSLGGDPIGALPVRGMPPSNKDYYHNINAVRATEGLILTGGNRSDSIAGSDYADVIYTGDGLLHYVVANGGNDVVYGGGGRDYIRAGSNAGTGANDHDVVYGGEGSDMIYGGAGDDQIWGNGSDEEYLRTAADSGERGDWLSGEAGNDTIYGSRSSDVIFGGAGADVLYGGAGNDLILGDAQYSTGSGAVAVAYATNTVSYVWSTNLDGYLQGPLSERDYGLDPVMFVNGKVFEWGWSGTEEDFSITLASGISFLSQQRVAAGGGNDFIDGGDGDDWIAGQTGDDIIYGGAGDDIIYGDDVMPLPNGAPDGNDILYAGAGRDVLFGGGGDDMLFADDDDGDLDRLYGGTGDDVLVGGTGHDELYGEAGNDQLFAGSDGSLMEGGEGNDLYVGGAGDDRMYDVSGNDIYYMGGGSNTIVDVEGYDRYYIYKEDLRSGGVTTLEDGDGVGQLYFGGRPVVAEAVVAEAEGRWRSTDGAYVLQREGGDLVLSSPEAGVTGQLVVQGFFGQEEFLGLRLPEYVPEPEPNKPPVVGAAIAAQRVDEDSALHFVLPADAFSDPDGDALTYSARLVGGGALPAWLSFDAATQSFSGTPENDDVGVLALEVLVSDGRGGRASQRFELEVVNTNDAPEVGVVLPAQDGQERQPFSYSLPANAFTDVDVGDVLTLSASGLPAWLRFDAQSGTFSGTPPVGTAGDVSWTVTATDLAGESVSQTLTLSVRPQPGNRAPEVGVPLAAQSTREWSAWAYALPSGAFVDADAGDVLRYEAALADGSALPYWLKFDPITGTLSSSEVAQGYAGVLDIRVTAVDLAGASASQILTLNVEKNQRLNPIEGTDRTDIKLGTRGNDLLIGGKGNDVLTGGLGDDTYRWSKGDGNDRLIELGGNDTLVLTDVNPDEVRISKTLLGDMRVSITSTGEVITVTQGLSSLLKVGRIEEIRFADGSSWDYAEMQRQSRLPLQTSLASVVTQPLQDVLDEDFSSVVASNNVLAASTAPAQVAQLDQLVQAMASFAPEAAASSGVGSQALINEPARSVLSRSVFA